MGLGLFWLRLMVQTGHLFALVKAASREDFWTSRYELAIATSRTSKKIDGAYQDVLTWARKIGDAETFFARINRSGSANPDMRTFWKPSGACCRFWDDCRR
jgi:hypothetical protein